jgi:hypothetical protein
MLSVREELLVSIEVAPLAAAAALEDDPLRLSLCRLWWRWPAKIPRENIYLLDQREEEIGRSVYLEDAGHGAAVWLLPQASEVLFDAALNERAFLETILKEEGCASIFESWTL